MNFFWIFWKYFLNYLWNIFWTFCETFVAGYVLNLCGRAMKYESALSIFQMAISPSRSEATITGCENSQRWKIPPILEIEWQISQSLDKCLTKRLVNPKRDSSSSFHVTAQSLKLTYLWTNFNCSLSPIFFQFSPSSYERKHLLI